MQYSEEFKQKVLAILGDSEEMRERLNRGDEVIGRYLYDAASVNISAEEIVAAGDSMNFQIIVEKAKKIVALKALYEEWCDEYRKQNQGMHK